MGDEFNLCRFLRVGDGDICLYDDNKAEKQASLKGEMPVAVSINVIAEPCSRVYDPKENIGLQDQASTPVDLLPSDTSYLSGSSVLKGVSNIGAQTVALARKRRLK
jgi:hypothetical protein